jgi:hypothetical protein
MTNAIESTTGIETTENIDRLTFGVEIETTRLGAERAARAIHEIVGGTVSGYGDRWTTTDRQGREWKCVPDGSISDYTNGTEVVTPPLRHSHDMGTLQAVVRNLRARGARVDSSCGIHVHVGLTSMGRTEKEQTRAVKNLCNIVHKHEEHINIAIGCGAGRQAQWAKTLPESFVKGIKKARKLDDILAHYYDKCGKYPETRDMLTYSRIVPGGYGAHGHYCNARYSGLNLHNLKYRTGNARTVEFRLFDATLHAGKVRAYVTFCLAMAARAANVSRTSYARRNGANSDLGREQCRWFVSKLLGLVGERYDTVREFVCDTHFNVDGSRRAVAAARNGAGYRDAA